MNTMTKQHSAGHGVRLKGIDTSPIVVKDLGSMFPSTTECEVLRKTAIVGEPGSSDIFYASRIVGTRLILKCKHVAAVPITTQCVELARATDELRISVIGACVNTLRIARYRDDSSRCLGQFSWPGLILQGGVMAVAGPAEPEEPTDGDARFDWSRSLYRARRAAGAFGSQTHGDY